ncbi:unnamed protein product [Phytomonas sp. Hart1]|nr:unnamed protein product [Phytomonas sp. Hart1]|eukprot:CCW66725.1 unnamed protein product [Phytomonas sp. isolate Hart1]
MKAQTIGSIVPPSYPRRQEQELENRKLSTTLSELVENATTVAENYLSYTEGRLPPLEVQIAPLTAALNNYLNSYRHEQPCDWTEDKILNRCKQQVTKDKINELAQRTPMDANGIIGILKALSGKDEIPRGRYLLLRDNLEVLKLHQGRDAILSLPKTLTNLYDIQHTDITASVRAEIAETDPIKNRLIAQVNEALAAFNAANTTGDVVEVERTHRHLIAARYEYLVLCAKRIRLLNGAANNAEVCSFSNELKQAQDDAEDALKQFKEEQEALKAAFNADLELSNKARREEEAKSAASASEYASKQKQMSTELDTIMKLQRDVIDELRRKALELRDLMNKQRDLTKAATAAKRAEEQRITSLQEFLNMHGQHCQRLQHCLAYLNSCKPVIEETERYVADMVKKLPRNRMEEVVKEITTEEVNSFMDAYKVFVFFCGELAIKKSHRLDTLERQARLTKHNQDSAMDSLDPNLENYRVELTELMEQMKAVEGVLNALNATQDAGEQVFENIEDVVRDTFKRTNETFVHPLQEFGHQLVDKRTRFVMRSMKYVENEEREVAQKKGTLEQMKTMLLQNNEYLAKAIAGEHTPTLIDSSLVK